MTSGTPENGRPRTAILRPLIALNSPLVEKSFGLRIQHATSI